MTNFRQEVTPQVDLVVPGWDNLDLTERLLGSLAQTAGVAYQVTYVDNGSEPDVVAALLYDHPQLRIVRLPFNHGFVRGTNAGVAQALVSGAPYVLWLNNDVEIPDGDPAWLERLLAPFADETVGAVGAVSDNVFGLQRRARAGVGETEAPILIGFALLVRRAAMIQVGFLDEQFEPGNYEDFDYSLRLRRAGWKLMIAESVWLRHAMHQTFQKLDVNFEQLLDVNLRKLAAKWGPAELAKLGLNVEGAGRREQGVGSAAPTIRLVTHATADWLPRIERYLDSLTEHWPYERWLLTVNCRADGYAPALLRRREVPIVPGAPEGTHSLQHGGFLPYVPGVAPAEASGTGDDVLVYTDGDIVLQRPPAPDERALLEGLRPGEVAAGFNSGPHETLALEATRLGVKVPDLAQVFDGELLATAACYNIGVIAARRATWQDLHARYLELYPAALQAFARQQRQQWLVCYVVAELGLGVEVLSHSFHAHGCYGVPPGVTFENGLAMYDGGPVLFRHNL